MSSDELCNQPATPDPQIDGNAENYSALARLHTVLWSFILCNPAEGLVPHYAIEQ